MTSPFGRLSRSQRFAFLGPESSLDPNIEFEFAPTTVNVNATVQIILRVFLSDGVTPAVGVMVIPTAGSPSSGTLTPVGAAVTNAQGRVTYDWAVGTQTGAQTMTFEVAASQHQSEELIVNVVDPGVTSVVMNEINVGGGAAGATISRTLEFTQNGVVVPNLDVEIASGYPTPSGSAQGGTTNGSGRVTIFWTLGSLPGSYALRITIPDTGQSFDLTSAVATSPAPSVALNQITNVDADSATLNATVNPNGNATDAWFEYDIDPSFGSPVSTSPQAIGNGSADVPINANISGLTNGQTYHVRAVASNATDTTISSTRQFTTQAPGAVTVIPAEMFRWDGNNGTVRVSSGFPFKPGACTNIDHIRVFEKSSGVEQAIAVQELYGIPHPIGGFRSVGIQLNADLTSDVPIDVEVHIDPAGRGTTDLAWIEPTYSGLIQNKAVIIPTDPQYICDTNIMLQPLQPEALDSTFVKNMMGTASSSELGEWADDIASEPPQPTHSSTYDHVQGLWCAWARAENRTRARQYYKWAYERLFDQMKGTAGTVGYFLPSASNAAYDKVTLPEDLGPGHGNGTPSEHHSGAYNSWGIGYWMTAWKQPWRQVCHKHSFAAGTSKATNTLANTRAKFTQDQYGIRRNTQLGVQAVLISYLVEATMQVPGAYGAGRNPNRSFVQELPFIPEAWELDAYQAGGTIRFNNGADSFPTDYLAGITCQNMLARHNCAHVEKQTTNANGHFPNFQAFIACKTLIFYYNNIYPDSRIPVFVKTWAEFVISQANVNSSNGLAYFNYEQHPNGTTGFPTNGNYYMSFFLEIFGFMYAYETDPTDKAKYFTWLTRAMTRAQMTTHGPTIKAFGEFFGCAQQSACYYYAGGSVRGIPGAHPDTLVEPRHHPS